MVRTLLATGIAAAALLVGDLTLVRAAEPLPAPATADAPVERQGDLWEELSEAADAVGRAARETSEEALYHGRRALQDVDGELAELGRRADAQATSTDADDSADGIDWTEKRLQLELLKVRAELALHRLTRGSDDTWDDARAGAAEALSDVNRWLRENTTGDDRAPAN